MQLRTSRLTLRPFRIEDIPDIAAPSACPEFGQHIELPREPLNSATVWVARIVAEGQPDSKSDWHFAIQVGDNPRLVGWIRLGVQDVELRRGDVGYALHPDFWGNGFMTEALKRLLAYGFDDLRLVRIWATTDVRNVASWTVMERAGMQREGVMRRHRLLRGEWGDSALYAAVGDNP